MSSRAALQSYDGLPRWVAAKKGEGGADAMSICALHGYNVEDCPICKITRLCEDNERLLATIAALREALDTLVNVGQQR